ncbi:hypothetical protein [Spirosoma lituiforme]
MNELVYSLSLVGLLFETGFAQCNQVVRHAEKQGNRVVIKSTSAGSIWTEPVQYKQVTEKGVTQFYIHLYALGGSLTDQQGASIFFKDGTVLEWPETKVRATFGETAPMNQCKIKLTESEIEQFQEKKISSIKLAGQERSLTTAQSQRAQDIINCVIYANYCDIKSDKLINQ